MDTLGAGLGLKPEHYDDALACRDAGLWFEVHAENYLLDGGPRLRWLDAMRARHPLSLHGVSLSLAGAAPPDPVHLRRLRELVRRTEPALVSEHLAWSSFGGLQLPDLLPFARTDAALRRIASHITQTQDALGRRIAIENPSHYLKLEGDGVEPQQWPEPAFLNELVRRSGCALLLDLNNVHVSLNNLGGDACDDLLTEALAYVRALDARAIVEIHLAGHRADARLGAALLIDSHDAPVAPAVWRLYERSLECLGARPTLIERDAELPPFDALRREARHAAAIAGRAGQPAASAASVG